MTSLGGLRLLELLPDKTTGDFHGQITNSNTLRYRLPNCGMQWIIGKEDPG